MKTIIFVGLLIIGFITNGLNPKNLNSNIKFATLDKAKELLTQEDVFTNSWSPFDIDARLHKKHSSKEELFNYISKQVRDWTLDEQKKIRSIIDDINNQILKQEFKINFPNEIYFIKTTTNEEGGAGGYTRANYVVLKDDIISQPTADLTQIIVHELFHILTRNNPEFRKNMYEIIGFKLMNNVEYPMHLKAYRITNPDAPQIDSYIKLKVGEQSIEAMMILYSTQDYSDGDFFKYLNVGFLSLKGDSIKSVDYNDDKPVIYSINEVTGFFEQVGKNTKYIIHPEEILADNFVFTIFDKKGLPNQDIVDKIKAKLKN